MPPQGRSAQAGRLAEELARPLLAQIAHWLAAAADAELCLHSDGVQFYTQLCPQCNHHITNWYRCCCWESAADREARVFKTQLLQLDAGQVRPVRSESHPVVHPCLSDYGKYRSRLLETICTLRRVCRHWRDCITYDSVKSLTISLSEWEPHFSRQLSGCVSLICENHLPELPPPVRDLRSVRNLDLSGSFEAFPSWFAELRLEFLALDFCYERHPDDIARSAAGESTARADRHAERELDARRRSFCEWLGSPATRLPATLQRLQLCSHTWDRAATPAILQGRGLDGLLATSSEGTVLPLCIRHLTNLRTLVLEHTHCGERYTHLGAQWERMPTLPSWLAELPLTSLMCPGAQIDDASVATIRQLPLEELDIECEAGTQFEAVEKLFAPGSAFETTLQRLHFRCDDARFTRVPSGLRRFIRLRSLEISAFFMSALPEWLGELDALVHLRVSCCLELSTLPVSLRGAANLREIDLSLTGLCDLEELIENGQIPELLDALDNMRFELLPLAASNPDVIFQIAHDSPWPNVRGLVDGWWYPRLLPGLLSACNWSTGSLCAYAEMYTGL
jgi:hypothetical protein